MLYADRRRNANSMKQTQLFFFGCFTSQSSIHVSVSLNFMSLAVISAHVSGLTQHHLWILFGKGHTHGNREIYCYSWGMTSTKSTHACTELPLALVDKFCSKSRGRQMRFPRLFPVRPAKWDYQQQSEARKKTFTRIEILRKAKKHSLGASSSLIMAFQGFHQGTRKPWKCRPYHHGEKTQ